jgi:SAM-dependent methyltransferase
MKNDIINFIICPVCECNKFDITASSSELGIISEGKLNCKYCDKSYAISKGIIKLYDKLSSTAELELKSHESEIIESQKLVDFQDENWLLNFPNVNRMGIDERSERIGRLISENTMLSIKKFIKKRNVRILEIGAGNCWVTAGLAKDNYCVALDLLTLSPIGLEAGEVFIKKREIHFERIVADMIRLPFKDRVFDYVIISSSLHHSPDILKTLNEIRRILNSNGKLVLLNEPSLGIFGSKERLMAVTDLENGINEKRYTINDWNKFFSTSGFNAEIYLPENLEAVIKTRGGLISGLSFLLNFYFLKKLMMPIFILKFLDGYFNAVLSPGK